MGRLYSYNGGYNGAYNGSGMFSGSGAAGIDGGCCGPAPLLLSAPAPVPGSEAVVCPAGSIPDGHPLLREFLERSGFSQFACRGLPVVSRALWDAESHVGGFFDQNVRDQALFYMTAHLLELSAVAAVESSARLAGAGKGTSSRPGATKWLDLTVWGLSYQQMQTVNPDLGLMVI